MPQAPSTIPPGPITLFAQDPAFNTLDEAFLKSLGITVLRESAAEATIRSDFYVMAPFFGFDHEILGRESTHRPSIYIGLPRAGDLRNARSDAGKPWDDHPELREYFKELEQRLLSEVVRQYDRFVLCREGCDFASDGNEEGDLDCLEVWCRGSNTV